MQLPPSSAGQRFDHAVAAVIEGSSVREVRRAIKEGLILINGRRRVPGDRAKGGEDIDASQFVARVDAEVVGEPDLSIKVLFEDRVLLALDKPSGMQTAPLRGNEGGTLLSAAIAHAPSIAAAGPPLEGGLLHRLDRDTSGVVLFAKDVATRDELRQAFTAHRVEKRYLAIVEDPGLPDKFEVESWIEQAGERVKTAEPHSEGALHAATSFVVLKRRGLLALVEATTFTGRRHQIRIHLANEDAPIAGDPLYGGQTSAPRLALHATSLKLPGRRAIVSELPEDLAALIPYSSPPPKTRR